MFQASVTGHSARRVLDVHASALVVPCFNEGRRLDPGPFLRMLQEAPDLSLLFVNDGSTDDTLAALQRLRDQGADRIAVLDLPNNVGKAEAVRQGMLQALASGAPLVGYFDADLSTQPGEMLALLRHLDNPSVHAVVGSRVALLGCDIQRHPARHFFGRIFATLASFTLSMRVYDTQCGAKAFRAGPALQAALSERFLSRWAFDVEIIGRLACGGIARQDGAQSWIIEVPLREWRDVGASKLRFGGMVKGFADLAPIAMDLRRRRLAACKSADARHGLLR